MLYEETLKELGLGKNTIKVYLSILQYPNLTIPNIAAKSGVHRVNVYDAIKELQKHSLVSEIEQDNKKIYRTTDPKQLFSILDSKKDKLSTVMPQLNKFYEQTENQAQIFEGYDGVKAILNDMIDVGKNIHAFGIPKEMPEKFNNFLIGFHKKRIKKNMTILQIYNNNATKRIKYLKTIKLSDARNLPPEFNVPTTTIVYGNKTAFWIWSENPFCVLIKSEKMAEAYDKYFQMLWSLAK